MRKAIMNETPQEGGETKRDLQQEITELEWFASQRDLTQAEAQRLHELQGQSGAILNAAIEQVVVANDGNKVVDGDDSP